MPAPGDDVLFTESELSKVVDLLEAELSDACHEHEERCDRMDEWQKAYDGDPQESKKNFPWPNAANLVVPIIAITTDSIVARLLNTIFAVNPFWTVRPLRKEVDHIAKPLEDYLDWSRQAEYNLYRAVRPWANEVVKFGWGWLKFGWEVYSTRDWITGTDSLVQGKETIIRRPNVYHILNRDIIAQAGVEDDEQAEWLCHVIRLTDNQLRMRRYDNLYDISDDQIANKEEIHEVHEQLQSSRDQPMSSKERLSTFYEFCGDFAWGPEKLPTPMLLTYHRPSKKLVRAIFNPYGFRMYKKAKFIDREGRYEGFGIAKRLLPMQKELSTIHNQQLDNATVANTRFFLGKKGQVRADTRIWPSKVVMVNNPATDLVSMQLGDIYPSMRGLEMTALSYAERASGVSDYQLGRESPVVGSGATATGTLALIQEGNRRFDLNIRDMRDVLSDVGRRVLELNQRFRPRGAAYFVQGSDGMYTEQALDMPPQFSISKLAVELTASTATVNREIEKQSLIALYGLVERYSGQLNQAAMAVANPQVPGEIKELMIRETQAMKYLMDRIVQNFDIKAIDTVVPSMVPKGGMQINGLDNGTGDDPGAQGEPDMGRVLGMLGEPGAGGPGGDGGLGDMGPVS